MRNTCRVSGWLAAVRAEIGRKAAHFGAAGREGRDRARAVEQRAQHADDEREADPARERAARAADARLCAAAPAARELRPREHKRHPHVDGDDADQEHEAHAPGATQRPAEAPCASPMTASRSAVEWSTM